MSTLTRLRLVTLIVTVLLIVLNVEIAHDQQQIAQLKKQIAPATRTATASPADRAFWRTPIAAPSPSSAGTISPAQDAAAPTVLSASAMATEQHHSGRSTPGAAGSGASPAATSTLAQVRHQPTPAQWRALRQCESGGDYTDKRNPKYRGAYQFDRPTWLANGGTGDPADATPITQDATAAVLFSRRGAQPWPQCGKWLQ